MYSLAKLAASGFMTYQGTLLFCLPPSTPLMTSLSSLIYHDVPRKQTELSEMQH